LAFFADETVNSMEDGLVQKSKWDEDKVRMVYELSLLGLTDAVMAKVMDISPEVFAGWKVKHPEFKDALKKGKMIADAKVAHAWYQRCTGYDYEEEHFSTYRGVPTVTKIQRHIPPDWAACARWLENRQREQWNTSHKVELLQTHININKFDFVGLSTEELVLAKKLGLSLLANNNGGNGSGN